MNRHICAVLFGGVLVLLMLASGAFGADGWWNESWQYRRAITINNTENPHDLFDYQVKIVVPRFNGMNYNFSDIRFIYKFGSKVRELPYWIENFTNESAIVWVKVPFIPKISNTTIYMYYGNPNATSESNGNAVFEFFDDFEGTSLDTSKWVDKNGGVRVENGYVKFGWVSNHAFIYTNQEFNYDVVIKLRAKKDDVYQNLGVQIGTTNQVCAYYGCNDTLGSLVIGHDHWDRGLSVGYKDSSCNGYTIIPIQQPIANTGKWHTYTLVFSHNIKKVYQDDNLLARSESSYWPSTSHKLGIMGREGGGSGYDYVDWIFVRKYAEPEPSVSIGKEQSRGFYISLMTDKANYSTGEVINLAIEVNRTQENPQVMKFKLELEDLDEKPDTLIETGSFVMPAEFHKKVVLKFAIPESPFVSSGRYAFKAYLIEPSLGEILAYDFVYFNVKEKEAKAKAFGSILA